MRKPLAVVSLLAVPGLWPQTTVNLKGPDGVTRQYTVRSHPRVMLDGATGSLSSVLKDPDGSGPQKSSRATGTAWNALTQRIQLRQNTAGGRDIRLAALAWWMDNNIKLPDNTSYLNWAKSLLLNAHKRADWGACDKAASTCASETLNDFIAWGLLDWANAYSRLRDQLTPTERARLAEQMMGGADNAACTNRLERMSGSVTTTAGSAVITTANVDFNSLTAGDAVYIKNPAITTDSGSWRTVASKQSASQITLSGNIGFSGTAWIFRIKTWEPGQCGLAFLGAHHSDTPSYVIKTSPVSTTLAAAISTVDVELNPVTTTISVAASNFNPGNHLPYYIRIGSSYYTGETMKVTAVNGNTLTVVRGEFKRTQAFNAGAFVVYQGFMQHSGRVDAMNNRLLSHHAGFLQLALATLDDYAPAKTLFENAVAWTSDYMYPSNRAYITGLTQSLSSYGPSRILPSLVDIYWSVRQSTEGANGSLDYFGSDQWPKRAFGTYWLYNMLPWNRLSHLLWGIQTNADCMTNISANCLVAPVWLQGIAPQSDEAKYAWHFLRNDALSSFSQAGLASDGGAKAIEPLLFFDYGTLVENDYRTALNSSRVFAETDGGSTTSLGTFISKSDWTPDATQFIGLFPDHFSDKMYDTFTSYAIGKKGSWLIGHPLSLSDTYGAPHSHMNTVDFGPVLKLGGRPDSAWTPGQVWTSGRDQNLDRHKVTGDYLYARVDSTNLYHPSYHGAERVFRNFLHLKTPGQREYIIVADDVAKTGPERIRSYIHYLNNGQTNEGTTSIGAGGASLTSTNAASPTAKLITYPFVVSGGATRSLYDLSVSTSGGTATLGADCSATAPCRAVINGTVYSYAQPSAVTVSGSGTLYIYLDPADGVLRAGHSPGAPVSCSGLLECFGETSGFPGNAIRLAKLTYANGSINGGCTPTTFNTYNGAEYDTCVGSQTRVLYMDAGTAEEGAFLAVHRPTLDLGEPEEAARTLTNIQPGYIGVEIDGPSPVVAVFSVGGARTSRVEFTTTHGGAARVFVSGLAEGTYAVYRNKAADPVATKAVEGDGTLYFESQAGEIEIRSVENAALQMAVSFLGARRAGAAYRQTLAVAGGIGPYSWTLLSGALPPGLSLAAGTGVISGIPAGAGTFNFSVRVMDSGNPRQTVDRPFSLTIQPAAALAVELPRLAVAKPGVAYAQAVPVNGGIAPYSWELISGTLPRGLRLEQGVIRGGVTRSAGTFPLAIAVSDSASPASRVEKALSLTVAGPAPDATPRVTAAGVTARKAILRYGRDGRPQSTNCTLWISDDPLFGTLLETFTDSGGPAWREYVAGETASLRPGVSYHVRVSCGTETAEGVFQTAAAPAGGPPALPFRVRVPAVLGADHVVIEYGPSPLLGHAITAPCADECVADLPASHDTVIYLRSSYRDASERVLAEGSLRAVAFP